MLKRHILSSLNVLHRFYFHLNSNIKTRLLRKLRKSISLSNSMLFSSSQISCFPCLPVLDFFHSSEIRKKKYRKGDDEDGRSRWESFLHKRNCFLRINESHRIYIEVSDIFHLLLKLNLTFYLWIFSLKNPLNGHIFFIFLFC